MSRRRLLQTMLLDEASGIETQQNDSGKMVAKDADLYAGCTVGIDKWVAALEKALEK